MNYLGAPPRGRRRGDLIWISVLIAMGALATGLSREQQNRIEALVRATVLYPVLELHRASSERARVGQRAVELQLERDSLVRALARMRALAAQASQLRASAGLALPTVGSVLTVEVYPGRPRIGDPDVFVLRAPGLADLVFPVGVFTGRGLVGVARGPHGAGARGEFWSHPDFRVSVRTLDGRVSGILRASRDATEQPVLLLEGAPFQEDVPPGTRLVTTGVAGVYPPGIDAGVVREEARSEPGWMKRYVVEPSVRPEEVGAALVWLRPPLGPSQPRP